MQQKGILSNVLDWVTHSSYSDEPLSYWAAGLFAVCALAFLWSLVIKSMAEV